MSIPAIQVEELKRRLEAGDNLFLLDVREEYEFEISNIGGHPIPWLNCQGAYRNSIQIGRTQATARSWRQPVPAGRPRGIRIRDIEHRGAPDSLAELPGRVQELDSDRKNSSDGSKLATTCSCWTSARNTNSRYRTSGGTRFPG